MRNTIIIVGIAAAIVGAGFVILKPGQPFDSAQGEHAALALDSFAQCLADAKITMYGADWCPHCQNEKKLFGDSFRFVPYVECPDNPQRCLKEGIKGYPTWVFPDGRKLVGEQGLEKLSQESGCPLRRSEASQLPQ